MSAQVDEPPASWRLLGPSDTSSTPLIICFHGSGESCSPSWDELALELSKDFRLLLYDRGARKVRPADFIKDLSHALADLPPPYMLIAHSHGGTFARYFLHIHPKDVAGMVMVETGQETALDSKIERRQYQQQVLGSKPLSVIRGNSLIANFKTLEAQQSDRELGAGLAEQRKMLELWDAEDERLKKAQLALSKNHRYVHIPDCGHHVIRDRSDVVAEEVRWAIKNSSDPADYHTGYVQRITKILRPRLDWQRLKTKD